MVGVLVALLDSQPWRRFDDGKCVAAPGACAGGRGGLSGGAGWSSLWTGGGSPWQTCFC
jgi:hypothetical protein